VLIEIPQGIKTFWVYLKDLLENYFKLSIISLKNSYEKIDFQNTILHLFKSYASLFPGEIFPKWFMKVALLKRCLKMNFRYCFIKFILWFLKDYFQNPNPILHYANKALWPIYKVLLEKMFYYENLFLTILKCCFDF
jgi:hypothetical protein